jgi:hypothetical protein
MSKLSLSERDILGITSDSQSNISQGDIVPLQNTTKKRSFSKSLNSIPVLWITFLAAWVGLFILGCHLLAINFLIVLWLSTVTSFVALFNIEKTYKKMSEDDGFIMFLFSMFSFIALIVGAGMVTESKSHGFGLGIPDQITWQAGTHMVANNTLTPPFGDQNRVTAGKSDMMIANAADTRLIGRYCPMTMDVLSRWPGENKAYDGQGEIKLTERGVVHKGDLLGWHMVDVATTGSAQGLLCGASKLLISDLAIHELNLVAQTHATETQSWGILEINRAESSLEPK